MTKCWFSVTKIYLWFLISSSKWCKMNLKYSWGHNLEILGSFGLWIALLVVEYLVWTSMVGLHNINICICLVFYYYNWLLVYFSFTWWTEQIVLKIESWPWNWMTSEEKWQVECNFLENQRIIPILSWTHKHGLSFKKRGSFELQ